MALMLYEPTCIEWNTATQPAILEQQAEEYWKEKDKGGIGFGMAVQEAQEAAGLMV